MPDEGGILKGRKWPHWEKLSSPALHSLSPGEAMKVSPLKNGNHRGENGVNRLGWECGDQGVSYFQYFRQKRGKKGRRIILQNG